MIKCPICKGRGHEYVDDATDPGGAMDEVMGTLPPCPACNGTGKGKIEDKLSVIPISVLQQVKTIITHAHCPDGVGSAILLHDVLPKAEIKFLTHDQLFGLPAEEGMLFCDIAPPMNRVRDFAVRGVVVLDHHKTAREVVESLGKPAKHSLSCEEDASSRNPCSCDARATGGFGIYSDEPGVSGAVLAYQHVWRPVLKERNYRRFLLEDPEADYFATLVGVRDTFQKNSSFWQDAWALSSALMFSSIKEWLDIEEPFKPGTWAEHRDFGQKIEANTRRRAHRAIAEGFHFTSAKNHTVLIVQGLELTTTIGDLIGNEVDIIVGFQYRTDPGMTEPRFQVSMRSHGKIDVAAIAKWYGGGGHTNAAGFTLHELPSFEPIFSIRDLLHKAGV